VNAPPPDVLAAFGATAEPRRLPGGQGGTWRAGDIVLKPAEGEVSVWRAAVLAELPGSPVFRVARPLRARDGGWVRAGWEAMWAVPGEPAPQRLAEIIKTGSAFHRAVAAVARPSCLDHRDDPWAYGDRIAWAEAGAMSGAPWLGTAGSARLEREVPSEGSALLEPLLAARAPVRGPAQLVHGDLLCNVLFAEGLPPAVIDWAPYWRPPAWACAVAVIDALCWHGARPDVLDRWAHLPDWGQMLVRALIFRIVTWDAAGWPDRPESAYRPVVDLTIAFLAGRRQGGRS
jgi:uncharacterized protein (TIGR02569 family)